MEGFEWHDPLLITDVSALQPQDQTQIQCKFCSKLVFIHIMFKIIDILFDLHSIAGEMPTFCGFETSRMENTDGPSPNKIDGNPLRILSYIEISSIFGISLSDNSFLD